MKIVGIEHLEGAEHVIATLDNGKTAVVKDYNVGDEIDNPPYWPSPPFFRRFVDERRKIANERSGFESILIKNSGKFSVRYMKTDIKVIPLIKPHFPIKFRPRGFARTNAGYLFRASFFDNPMDIVRMSFEILDYMEEISEYETACYECDFACSDGIHPKAHLQSILQREVEEVDDNRYKVKYDNMEIIVNSKLFDKESIKEYANYRFMNNIALLMDRRIKLEEYMELFTYLMNDLATIKENGYGIFFDAENAHLRIKGSEALTLPFIIGMLGAIGKELSSSHQFVNLKAYDFYVRNLL